MLYLFGPKETDFVNGDSDLIHNTYDEVVERAKGFYLKFKMTLDKDEQYKKVKKEMIISAYTPDGWNQFRVFDIYNYSHHVEVVATQLHYDLNYKKVYPFNAKNVTAQAALNLFVSKFKSDLPNFKFTSSIDVTRNFSTDDDLERLEEGHNALEILNRMADRWGGELDVNGYNVRLVPKLGKFTNALLYEHKNIAEFVDETSMSEIITRIHAVTRFRPERVEGSEDEPEEVTIKVVVDSPLINEYAQVYEEDYTNNDARTKAELVAWARLKYSTNSVDKPARSIKVETNIIDGQEINYGDDLVLKYTKHDVDEIIRCVGYQYNPNSKQYISVTLGSNTKTLSSTITGAVHDSTRNQFSNMEKQVQAVRYAANDRNRATTGPLPVPNPIDGDIWYYHPEGRPNEVELRIYQNGGWETIVNDLTGENIRKTIDAIELEADTLAEDIAASDQKAAEALAEAGVSSNLAQTAKDLATTAKTNAATAETNAADALAEASEAKNQAGKAVADALTAMGDARLAKTDAQTAMSDAQSALSTANGLDSTVSTLSSEVDTVAGKVTLKADQTEVDTVKGTVSTHTTTLSQHATAISSKASQTEVDTVKGTVATHTSTLSQQAEAISARLTQTQVNNLVSGKGYSTVSYVDTEMSATAGAIRTEMTAIEGKIPTEIGVRNLLKNSKPITPISTDAYHVATFHLTETPVVGETYTFVLKGELASTKTSFNIYNSGGAIRLTSLEKDGDYYVGTFTWRNRLGGNTASDTYVQVYQFMSTEPGSSTIEWITLMRGDAVMKDWTPAPEDVFMQNEFNSFKASYDQSAEGWSAKLLQIEQAGYATKTWSNETFATPQSITTALNSYAKTTDLNGLATESYVGTQIKASADGIKAELTKVEGKIPDSVQEENLVIKGDGYHHNTNYMIAYYNLTKDLKINNTYTAVLKGGIGSDGVTQKFTLFTDNGGNNVGNMQYVPNSRGLYRLTFVLVQRGADSGDKKHIQLFNRPNNGSAARIEWIKLIEGDVTDNYFTPSRVDLITQHDYTAFTTDFDVKAQGWAATTTYVDNNKTKMNSLISNADGWASTISYVDTNKTKINNTISTVDSYVQTIGTNGEKIASLVMTDSVYQTSIRKGGRNLLRDSYGWIANPDRAHSSFDIKDPIPHGTKVTLSFRASSGANQIVQIYNTNAYHNYGDVKITKGTTPDVYHLTFTTYTHSNGGSTIDVNNQQIRFYNKLEPNPTAYIQLYWAVLQYGEIGTEHYISDDEDFETQVTQLENSWALRLKSGDDIKTQINATTSGIRLQGKTIQLDGNTVMNNAFARSLMVDKLVAADVTAFTGKFHKIIANNIDVNNISGTKSTFLESAWTGLNSRAYIDSRRIRIESGTQGAYVELNNIPEFRSQYHDGTGVVMAKGRVQFFEPNGGSQGYIGRDIHTGTNDFGIFISRGKGFRIARATDASSSSADDKYYTVVSGKTWRVAIIEDMVRKGILQDGNSTQFEANSNKIARLNGWPILPQDWPTQRVGDQILYEKGKIVNEGATGVRYEDIINFGKNGALTDWWLYMRQHVRFEAGYTSASDRRIKHNIQSTDIVALNEIESLDMVQFNMNSDGRYVPLGLIAQEAGILRVPDEKNEGINVELATMLSLKGVQELYQRIKELEEEVKILKENDV